MNSFVATGRLTKDPDIRTSGEVKVARYTLAVDRRFKKEGQPTADFISCVVFGKGAEFAEKWLRKGIKIGITGRIQTGSYDKQDGTKVYTTDVVVESQEFMESKAVNEAVIEESRPEAPDDEFLSVDAMMDDELPF